MADSYKLDALVRLTALLETITVANGYEHDLAGNVFRGRARFGENDPATMVSLLEAPRQDDFNYGGANEARAERFLVLAQGWCPDDSVNPSDPVYRLLADVESRLTVVNATGRMNGEPVDRTHYMLGGTIVDFRFGPGVVRPATEGISSKAFFYLPIRIGLASNVA